MTQKLLWCQKCQLLFIQKIKRNKKFIKIPKMCMTRNVKNLDAIEKQKTYQKLINGFFSR